MLSTELKKDDVADGTAVSVVDNKDGSYALNFTPDAAGRYALNVDVMMATKHYPISRAHPFVVDVAHCMCCLLISFPVFRVVFSLPLSL